MNKVEMGKSYKKFILLIQLRKQNFNHLFKNWFVIFSLKEIKLLMKNYSENIKLWFLFISYQSLAMNQDSWIKKKK